MSTSRGVAPVASIAFTVATNVSGVVITSSPGPTPTARSDEFERRGARVHRHDVARADVVRELTLEPLHQRTLADPSGPDDLGDQVELGLVELGLPEDDGLGVHRRTVPIAETESDRAGRRRSVARHRRRPHTTPAARRPPRRTPRPSCGRSRRCPPTRGLPARGRGSTRSNTTRRSPSMRVGTRQRGCQRSHDVANAIAVGSAKSRWFTRGSFWLWYEAGPPCSTAGGRPSPRRRPRSSAAAAARTMLAALRCSV